MRIIKFELQPRTTEIEVGQFGRSLCVGWQDERLCVWAEAWPGTGSRVRFATVPTGEECPEPDEAIYVGTAHRLIEGRPFVVHVYQELVR